MARPRRDLSDQTIAIAREVFLDRGFQDVRLDDIVRQLGTSKSAFYRHFQSKHALVEAVMEALNQSINADLRRIVDGPGGFVDKLSQVTRYTSNLLNRVSDKFFEDLRTLTPDLWEDYMAARKERVDHIYGRLFQSGQEAGAVRRDVPQPVITHIYLHLTRLVVDPDSIRVFRRHNADPYKIIQAVFLEGSQISS